MMKQILVLLLFLGLHLREAKARCGKKNITSWFGTFSQDPYKQSSEVESCIWKIEPPKNSNSVLIIKLISFFVWPDTNAMGNYLRFPEGIWVTKNNYRQHLHVCKRYTKKLDPNPCPKSYLDNYCKGSTYESTEWPPTIRSYSSPNSQNFHLIGFTVSYVYVTCPTQGLNASHPVLQTQNAQEKDSMLPIAVGTIAAFLIILLVVLVFVLAIKLRTQRHANKYEIAFAKSNDPTYSYAADVCESDSSSNIYASVATLKNRDSEGPPRLPNDYLTMRGQESKRETNYHKIRTDSTNTDTVAIVEKHKRKMTESRSQNNYLEKGNTESEVI